MLKNKIILFLMICVSITSLLAQPKKRVAVFTFEDKTDRAYRWWDGRGPGDGMADMLTTELVKSGKYTVIERQEIESIMSEQNLGATGRVTEQSAAQIGKLLGVELAVMGSVTEFGIAKKDVGIRIKGIGLGKKDQKATVGIDVRLVNTNTGEIILAENVRKEESKGGIAVSTSEWSFNNKNQFDNSIAGKATRAAIEEIMDLIENQMKAMPWEGKIILVQGPTIIIKPGSDSGISIGDQFVVYSKGQELIDPDTGLSLGSMDEKIGTIKITSFISGGKASKAAAVSGSGFKKGDMVRLE